MRSFFLSDDLFHSRCADTAFLELPEREQLVAPMWVEDRQGVILNEQQFSYLFSNGTDGFDLTPTSIYGLTAVVPSTSEAVEPDPVVSAPVVLTEGQVLLAHCAPTLESFSDLGVFTFPDEPFVSCDPRSTGTGIRIICALPPSEEYRSRANTQYIDVLDPYSGYIYCPSGRGQALSLHPTNNEVARCSIAELFMTADGGMDVFLMLNSDHARQDLQDRATITTGRYAGGYLKIVLTTLRTHLHLLQRLQLPRAERFASQADAFEQFGALAFQQVLQNSQRELRQILHTRESAARQYRRASHETVGLDAHVRSLQTIASTQQANQNEQLTRLLQHPKVLLVEVPSNFCLEITTTELNTRVPDTDIALQIGQFKIRLDLDMASAHFLPLGGKDVHPCLQNRDVHDTTSIDAAICELLSNGSVFQAFRQALRFLEQLDPAHPCTPTVAASVTPLAIAA